MDDWCLNAFKCTSVLWSFWSVFKFISNSSVMHYKQIHSDAFITFEIQFLQVFCMPSVSFTIEIKNEILYFLLVVFFWCKNGVINLIKSSEYGFCRRCRRCRRCHRHRYHHFYAIFIIENGLSYRLKTSRVVYNCYSLGRMLRRADYWLCISWTQV